MGWSDVKIAMRYVHPSEDSVLAALEGLALNGSQSQCLSRSDSGSNADLLEAEPARETRLIA